jgi:hypothetical protein
MQRFFLISVISVLVLSGCTVDDPDDGLVGDELTTPLAEVVDYIETGDGQSLCRHLQVYFNTECPATVAPSLGVPGFEPVIFDLPSGQLFSFNSGAMVLDIERIDTEFDGETFYDWQIRDFSMPRMVFPSGGRYAGTSIDEGGSFLIMPGDLDENLLQLNVDSDGFWEAILDTQSSTVRYELSEGTEARLLEEFSAFCDEYVSTLNASDLLSEPAPTFFWRVVGQEDDARGIRYLNPGTSVSEFRTVNYPEITQISCAVSESDIATEEFGDGMRDFIAEGKIAVSLEGDAGRLLDRNYGRAIYTYDWLPREFQKTFILPMSLLISVDDNKIVEFGLDIDAAWEINEIVVDRED